MPPAGAPMLVWRMRTQFGNRDGTGYVLHDRDAHALVLRETRRLRVLRSRVEALESFDELRIAQRHRLREVLVLDGLCDGMRLVRVGVMSE